ncbi:MAG: hypothetical protein ACE5QF_06165 [Thermoplasmata archaeon]
MNDKEYLMFYSALEWTQAHEYERLLSQGMLPAFTQKMPVNNAERLRRTQSTVLVLKDQAARWDGLVHIAGIDFKEMEGW